MVKSKMPKTRKIQVTFTNAQIEMIDNIRAGGRLGHKRAEVIKHIVMLYLDKKETKEGL